MKRIQKKETGITLIALVLTIIVLLILAGVSIAMLTNDNGIINQTDKAKENTEISSEKEVLEVSTIQAMEKDRSGNVTYDNFDNALEDNIGKGDYNLSGEGPFIVKFVDSGRNYVVDKDGNVNILEKGTAIDVSLNAKDYYGEYVDYLPNNGVNVKWRIFHSDDENIYLIADSYIESDYVPKTRNGTALNVGSSKYCLYWQSIRDEYIGAEDIKETNPARKWLSYISEYPNSTNENMKMVAYMLDTELWQNFENSYAENAIGGPTIDLYVASYNKIHNRKIEYKIDEVGYLLKWEDENEFSNILNDLPEEESIYVPKSNSSTAYSVWIASPYYDDYHNWFLEEIRSTGDIGGSGPASDMCGLKPIVCLKSDVKLEKQEDGTYKIIE